MNTSSRTEKMFKWRSKRKEKHWRLKRKNLYQWWFVMKVTEMDKLVMILSPCYYLSCDWIIRSFSSFHLEYVDFVSSHVVSLQHEQDEEQEKNEERRRRKSKIRWKEKEQRKKSYTLPLSTLIDLQVKSKS